jgi:hypothetical protein
MKKGKLFQKKVDAPVRPTFRAMLVIDPQNLAGAQLQPIEGELQLDEVAAVLGMLHDQCLVQFGVASEQKRTQSKAEEETVKGS